MDIFQAEKKPYCDNVAFIREYMASNVDGILEKVIEFQESAVFKKSMYTQGTDPALLKGRHYKVLPYGKYWAVLTDRGTWRCRVRDYHYALSIARDCTVDDSAGRNIGSAVYHDLMTGDVYVTGKEFEKAVGKVPGVQEYSVFWVNKKHPYYKYRWISLKG